MERQSEPSVLVEPKPHCYFGGTLFWLRWVTLAALFSLAVAEPITGRVGLPIWTLLLIFAAYNLLVEVFQKRLSGFMPLAWVPMLDLPAAGIVYFLGASPGGPLFVLFLLITGCAATCMTLRGSVIYTIVAAALVIVIAPTLPLWSPDAANIAEMGVQLVVLAWIGIGTALLMRHMRRVQERARASREEAERLEELAQLRSRFISSISHDLRTPLTAIRAAVGMLMPAARDRLAADEQELLDSALRNTNRLSMLIDGLLTFNQLQAGVLPIERESLDLRRVVTQSLATVLPLIREKGQTVEIDLPEPLPYNGDHQRLEQVLVNLLANANQHTPPGTRIVVSGQSTADEVRISVRDNGPGIRPDELETIFDRFYRLATTKNRSGLGLAIARSIIELHGGRIWAETQPGQGTVFHVALPRTEEGGSI